MPDKKNKSINKVHIFSVGTWNGDAYTAEDLDEMVAAFKATKDHVQPFLKLGHARDQKLLQNDGLPAAGWVGNMYREGNKLFADLVDIPRKIYDLIEKKAYKKVSLEIYWNVNILKQSYKKLVGAVALLGANTPGVMNLDDILAQYGIKDFNSLRTYCDDENTRKVSMYSFDNQLGELNMADDIIKQPSVEELQTKLTALEAEKKGLQEQLQKLAALQEEKENLSNKLEDKETDLQKSDETNKQLSARLNSLEKIYAETKLDAEAELVLRDEGLPKSAKQYVKALLGADRKEYQIKDGDKDVALEKKAVLVSLLKALKEADSINLDEKSVAGKVKSDFNMDSIDAEIAKYSKENECSYADAYAKVAKNYDFKTTRLVEEEA